jgi:hypothetical protein
MAVLGPPGLGLIVAAVAACSPRLPDCGAAGASCAEIGARYERGDRVKVDLTTAGRLYERGCTLGEADSCRALGRLHEGDSPALAGRDLEGEAASFLAARRPDYEARCTRGQVDACEVLGDLLHFGLAGTPVDEPRSKRYYGLACQGGSATACKKQHDPDWLAAEVRGKLQRRAPDASTPASRPVAMPRAVAPR